MLWCFMAWKNFEQNVLNFLKSEPDFAKFDIIHSGDSDSTKSDIYFYYKTTKLFGIECKEGISQASQFVVLLDEKSKLFYNSPKNRSVDQGAEEIITEMNKNYNHYKGLSTSGNDLICSEDLILSMYGLLQQAG